jgi:site-specific DNA-methyltransferase (adenine-specific)
MIKLIKGDCLEKMKDIADKSIDAIITDPPYGTTDCKWDSIIDLDLMWKELNRVTKPNGTIILFGSEPFSSVLLLSNIKNYKHKRIWIKDKAPNFLQAANQPKKNTEDIIIFSFGSFGYQSKIKCAYNPIMTPRETTKKKTYGSAISINMKELAGNNNTILISDEKYNGNLTYPNETIYYPVVYKNKKHPTQKPVGLMEYLIKTYTNENQTVLDFTMGSGSTGVAAKNTNRNFIGIEQDDKYFEIAEQRINGTLF